MIRKPNGRAAKTHFAESSQKGITQLRFTVGKKALVMGSFVMCTPARVPGIWQNPTQKIVPTYHDQLIPEGRGGRYIPDTHNPPKSS